MIMMRGKLDTPSTGAQRRISDLASNVLAISKKDDDLIPLPSDFHPGPLDVICARGKQAYSHTGNKRLRVVIEMNLEKYNNASSKIEKSLIVSAIVDSVREASSNGGFIKEEGGRMYIANDNVAREKVGQR